MKAKDRELAQKVKNVFLTLQIVDFLLLQLQEEQLQSSEREKQTVRQQLTRKEAELTRAEETIRREQQQNQEMRQRVSLVCCDYDVTIHVSLTTGERVSADQRQEGEGASSGSAATEREGE